MTDNVNVLLDKPEYNLDENDPVAIAVSVDAVTNGTKPENKNTIEFSTGVVVRVDGAKLPKMALMNIYRKFNKTKPKVPRVFVEAKGRKEENTGDPDYIEAIQMWQTDQFSTLISIGILRAVVVQHVPDDIISYDSDDWRYEAELLGIPQNDRALFLEWVMTIAAPEVSDTNQLMEQLGRNIGTLNQDVDRKVSGF